jgi:hypothetical protein
MNPIKEAWAWAGEAIWKRRWKGSWKKRAIAAETELRMLRLKQMSDIPHTFKQGWQTGWEEAIRIAGIQFKGFERPTEDK